MNAVADIFIPTAKSTETLERCLQRLERQTNRNFRILLVSREESPKIQRILASHQTLQIISIVQKKRGLVNAANLALTHATHPIFIRIDDDVEVHESWFASIVKLFSSDPKIGAVTGPTLLTNKGKKARDLILFLTSSKKNACFLKKLVSKFYIGYLYENHLYEVGQFMKSGAFGIGANFYKYSRKQMEVSNLEACNFAVRLKLLRKIGGFDMIYNKGLGDYHEADMAFMVKALGYRIVFDPHISVTHRVESDSPLTRPEAYFRIQNFIIFYRRHIGIKNFDHFCRFFAEIGFQNTYYLYKFFRTGDFRQLGAFPGTFMALLK